MSRHTAFAHLPLDPGKAPAWLFGRMRPLAREITCLKVALASRRRPASAG